MTALRQDDILSAVWRACDTFRGAVDATQYKDYVLTALFLKYISDVRRKHVEEFRREYRGDEIRIQRRLDRERFKLPKPTRFKKASSETSTVFTSAAPGITLAN
jgi:type I restriction enzyme M protein